MSANQNVNKFFFVVDFSLKLILLKLEARGKLTKNKKI